MTIEFSPNANKSNIAGATAPAAKATPGAPNQLMALGEPPPDFAGPVDGWVKAIREMLWPQTQSEGDQSTSGAKSEGSEDKSEQGDFYGKPVDPDHALA